VIKDGSRAFWSEAKSIWDEAFAWQGAATRRTLPLVALSRRPDTWIAPILSIEQAKSVFCTIAITIGPKHFDDHGL
jgi:hypothetical protein